MPLSNSPQLFDKPHQPQNIPQQNLKNRKFNFQTKLYVEYPWLHFDTNSGGFSCFCCCKAIKKGLLGKSHEKFIRETDLLNGNGFKKWNKAAEKFLAHNSSPVHLDAVCKLDGMKAVPVCTQLSLALEKQQHTARVALKAIFNSVRYLARQGIALRGHNKEGGNFFQLNELRRKDIPELNEFINREKNFCSYAIQNEMLEMMAHAILRQIITDIKENRIYSLIVDETCDISGKEQVSICVRTVKNLEVQEFFLGLYETSITTGNALVCLILDALQRFDLSLDYLRGQCYDGGSNMSGIRNGVQAILKEKQPLALYVHCNSHCLNLALQDTSKCIPLLRDTMNLINEFGVFLGESPKRQSQFQDIQLNAGMGKISSPRPLCPTRWTVRTGAINSTLVNYTAIISFLEILINSNDPCANKARGLQEQFLKGETYFGLHICLKIFEPCEKLSTTLQKSTQTLHGAKSAVITVLEHLKARRNAEEFENLWSSVEESVTELELDEIKLPRLRRVPKRLEHCDAPSQTHKWTTAKDMHRAIYYEAIDVVCGEIERRFHQPDFETCCLLEKTLLTSPSEWTNSMKQVIEDRNISSQKLILELQMFRQLHEITCISKAVDKFTSLHPETRSLFPHTEELLRCLLVIPATSATAERNFSMLRRMKTYLRSTMSQERLNHLCVLHTYIQQLDNVKEDLLLAEFVNNEYRKSVFGKI